MDKFLCIFIREVGVRIVVSGGGSVVVVSAVMVSGDWS